MSKATDKFLKDKGLSFQHIDDESTRLKLQLHDKCFGTDYLQEYDSFITMIAEDYNNPDQYLAEYGRIRDTAISYIKSRPRYQEFLDADFEIKQSKDVQSVGVSPYHLYNDGGVFVSVDICKANFSSLKYFGVFEEDTWEDFLSKFTTSKHVISSKYIRQVILGNCCPKKQIQLESILISRVFSEIRHNCLADLFATEMIELVAFASDEFVIRVNEIATLANVQEAISHAIAEYEEKLNISMFKMETYKLHALTEDIELYSNRRIDRIHTDTKAALGYIRQFYEGELITSRWDCKCLDNVRFPLLMAQATDMWAPPCLFKINTQYGIAILESITMPHFNSSKLCPSVGEFDELPMKY